MFINVIAPQAVCSEVCYLWLNISNTTNSMISSYYTLLVPCTLGFMGNDIQNYVLRVFPSFKCYYPAYLARMCTQNDTALTYLIYRISKWRIGSIRIESNHLRIKNQIGWDQVRNVTFLLKVITTFQYTASMAVTRHLYSPLNNWKG